MNKTVAAVVVTYNRRVLLGECLAALLAQSRPLAAVYVIDNASTDGTAEYLEALGYCRNPLIHYVRLERNRGGAGGFAAGVEIASRAGHGWIWLMDDDAEPLGDALQKMMPYMKHEGVSAIANTKLNRQGEPEEGHLGAVASRFARAEYPRLYFSSFVGLMVRGSTVARIGLPKSEFFLHGDDNEYCNRLCRAGDICWAKDSIIVHKYVREANVAPVKRRLRFTRQQKNSLPVRVFCTRYYSLRNRLWCALHSPNPVAPNGQLGTLLREYGRRLLRVLLIDRDHRRLRLRVLGRAFWDGLTGHFDNEFVALCQAKVKEVRVEA